jgi:hypothetical protein
VKLAVAARGATRPRASAHDKADEDASLVLRIVVVGTGRPFSWRWDELYRLDILDRPASPQG